MCTVCGCGDETIEKGGHGHARGHGHGHGGHAHGHSHGHDHAHDGHHHHHGDHHHHHHHHDHDRDHDHHHHDHDHGAGDDHVHAEDGTIHYGTGIAGTHVPGLSQNRIVQIERDILSKNDRLAAANRLSFSARGIFALNLVSSPGSGKTSLLVKTIQDLKDRIAVTVIEGDQQTANDAERIRATGAKAIQVNTGKGCHLNASMVGAAFTELDPPENSVLMIENVGNLVCPAAFDLGEAHKVVVLSVTEGEDKPLKYPDMFAAADLMLLNKSDLIPHLDFNVGACMAAALRVNPDLQILTVSARTGEGMEAFYAWIEARASTFQLRKAV